MLLPFVQNLKLLHFSIHMPFFPLPFQKHSPLHFFFGFPAQESSSPPHCLGNQTFQDFFAKFLFSNTFHACKARWRQSFAALFRAVLRATDVFHLATPFLLFVRPHFSRETVVSIDVLRFFDTHALFTFALPKALSLALFFLASLRKNLHHPHCLGNQTFQDFFRKNSFSNTFHACKARWRHSFTAHRAVVRATDVFHLATPFLLFVRPHFFVKQLCPSMSSDFSIHMPFYLCPSKSTLPCTFFFGFLRKNLHHPHYLGATKLSRTFSQNSFSNTFHACKARWRQSFAALFGPSSGQPMSFILQHHSFFSSDHISFVKQLCPLLSSDFSMYMPFFQKHGFLHFFLLLVVSQVSLSSILPLRLKLPPRVPTANMDPTRTRERVGLFLSFNRIVFKIKLVK